MSKKPDPLMFRMVRWLVVGAIAFTAVGFGWSLISPPEELDGLTYRQLQERVREQEAEIVQLKGKLARSELRVAELEKSSTPTN